jgi:hypothetical protein
MSSSTQRLAAIRALAAFALAFVLALGPPVRADGSAKQALLLAKALSYERRLAERKGSSLGIAILYAADNDASKASAQSWLQAFQALGALKVHGVPVEVVTIALQRDRVSELVRARGIDVLLACEGSSYATVAALAREQKILSVADARAGVASNLSLAVLIDREKPLIFINVRAAKAEGAVFSAKLLQLANLL